MLKGLMIMTSQMELISISTMIGKLRKILMFEGLFLKEYSIVILRNAQVGWTWNKKWLSMAWECHVDFRILLICRVLAGYTKKVSTYFVDCIFLICYLSILAKINQQVDLETYLNSKEINHLYWYYEIPVQCVLSVNIFLYL